MNRLFLSLLLLWTIPAHAADTVKIGVISALGGTDVDFVHDSLNGMNMAVAEANKAGGVDGKKVELLVTNSGNDPDLTLTHANEMLLNQKPPVYISAVYSSVAMGLNSWAGRNHVPIIHTTSNSDNLVWAKGNHYVFRSAYGTYQHLSSVIDYALSHGLHLDGKKIAIIAPSDEWGTSMVDSFKQILEEKNIHVTYTVEVRPKQSGMIAGAETSAFKKAPADVYFISLFGTDLIKFIREANKRGILKSDIPVINPVIGLAAHVRVLAKTPQEYPIGWYTAGLPDDFKDKAMEQFAHKFFAMYPDVTFLDQYSMNGYIAAHMAIAALKEAKDQTPEDVTRALYNIETSSPFGPVHARKIDGQILSGIWAGRSGLVNGRPGITDWEYIDWKGHVPSDEWIEKIRAKGAQK